MSPARVARRHEGAERVVERGGRPAKATQQARRPHEVASRERTSEAARKAFRLRCAAFDQLALAKQTYLTVLELCAYGRFESENAAYLFLSRHTKAVPKCRRGRAVTVRRVDYDRFVQSHVAGAAK